MNALDHIQSVYLIGIGGIGMSALARYFQHRGKTVGGYDRVRTELTDQLAHSGMSIHFEDDVNLIPEAFSAPEHTLVIYTPAIPRTHAELTYFRNNGYLVMKRSEVLGKLSEAYRTIAIAGTHGKTTTTSIVAHLLHASSFGCNAFLGGISTNYGTNLLVSDSSHLMAVEADEFDRSFLTLSPEWAVITSMDADHLDVYGTTDQLLETFHAFTGRISPEGTLIYRHGLPLDHSHPNTYSYGLDETADFHLSELTIEHGQYRFNLHSPTATLGNVRFSMPGMHNVENAVAAFAVADQIGLTEQEIRSALASYKGVKRRFEVHINTPELVYVDDYAHHPTELTACISAVRQLFPGRTVRGIFQPHLYSRTRDLMDDFAHSLSQLDELTLLDIYPAREEPIPGISSQALLNKVGLKNKELSSKQQVLDTLSPTNTDVLLTLGAGDIDQLVSPIKKTLTA